MYRHWHRPWTAPLDQLEERWHAARRAWSGSGGPPPPEVPIGVGWLGYDLARQWLPRETRARPGGDWPLLEFRFFDAVWIRDAGRGEARIVACDEAAADRLAGRLAVPPSPQAPPRLGPLEAQDDGPDPRGAHAAAVARIKDYLFAGDAYQVNLARRLTATISEGDPLWMAATLRARAPAPHAIWMGSRSRGHTAGIDRYLMGNSPERFLRVTPDGAVETRPIKGTRPRGGDAASDAAAHTALASRRRTAPSTS